jgi:hypothetical protein
MNLMKNLLIASILCLTSVYPAQVLLQEDFNYPFNPAAAGWDVQNLSQVTNTSTTFWQQGDAYNYFAAFNGQMYDYLSADYFGTDVNAAGTISNWLITPPLIIYNGAVLQFATRTESVGAANLYPDRMQVRMSTVASASVIPAGVNSVGSFSNMLLDINPNLVVGTSSAVSNGSVNGYPNVWTVYTVAVTGVTGTVTGRFAFRYFVTNGGLQGANSLYIGLDAVRYTLPCGLSVPNYSICAGNSATLTANGALSTTGYLWDNSSTSSSIVVSPTATTVYTLIPYNGTMQCGNTLTSTVTVGSSLSFSIASTASAICAGSSATLSALSPATTFSWNTGSTSNTIVVSPTVTTTYSVTGIIPAPGCSGGTSYSLIVNALPQLNLSTTPDPICFNDTDTMIVLQASGGIYHFVFGSTVNPVSVSTPSPNTYPVDVFGVGANGCGKMQLFNIVVSETPTLITLNVKSPVCTGNAIKLQAGGANSYTWSGAATGTSSSFSFTTLTPGTLNFSVIGTNTEGCADATSFSVVFDACLGLDNPGETHLAISPNPFSDLLNISGASGSISVFSVSGQLVYQADIESYVPTALATLPSGLYLLRLHTENKADFTLRLLKQ